MRFDEFPFFMNFRFQGVRTPPDELPVATQRTAIDAAPISVPTESDETGNEAAPERTTPTVQPVALMPHQFSIPIQTISADIRGYVQVRTSRDEATASVPHADGAGTSPAIQAPTGRDDTETLPDATTAPESFSFIPEAAGILTGRLPFSLAAIAGALRELQPGETTFASAVPPCVRVIGLGAWFFSAVAYVLAQQRWKQTTDFDDLTALRKIALKNKDRQ